MNAPNPKFDIERENQELKVFFFTVQKGPMAIEIAEDFKAVMAYNDQGAIDSIKKDYTVPGQQVTARKRGEVPIKKILDAVNLNVAGVPQDLKITVTPPPPREKTAHDFIYGMLLISDKFVVDKRDRASLKRIINKIKIHEDQPITESKENLA